MFFYVIGDSRENELMLLSVLNALYESISMILRKNVEKRALFDHMDRLVGLVIEAEEESLFGPDFWQKNCYLLLTAVDLP